MNIAVLIYWPSNCLCINKEMNYSKILLKCPLQYTAYSEEWNFGVKCV